MSMGTATRFRVLCTLIETDAELHGEDGYHHVLVDVVNEIAESHGSEEALVDALYDLVACSFLPVDGSEKAVVNTVDDGGNRTRSPRMGPEG